MKLLGFEITRPKAVPADLRPVDSRGGWFWPIIRESFTGAWQQNVTVSTDTALTHVAVYACITRIAADFAKNRVKLVREDEDDIWTEVDSAAFSPVLRKPNRYQTRVQFLEQWMSSKLIHGNAYILKERDARGVVTALYVLDACRTKPLVAPDGDVFYQLKPDALAGVEDSDQSQIIVPASEIIHDIMVALFHPLVGVSPLYAAGLAATQGVKIQTNSTNLFTNGARPSGILTAPGSISADQANRLKAAWDTNFSGDNVGRVAVVSDGLKFEPMSITAEDSQLIEQLKWTVEAVCACFNVPPYIIGFGAPPTSEVGKLMALYHSSCLQRHFESAEVLLDEGLELPKPYGTEFDIENLMRMDTAALYETVGKGIAATLLTPNEGRKKIAMTPLEGGDTVYMQQQNFSLAALAQRDRNDPFSRPDPAAPAADSVTAPPANDNSQAAAFEAAYIARKALGL